MGERGNNQWENRKKWYHGVTKGTDGIIGDVFWLGRGG